MISLTKEIREIYIKELAFAETSGIISSDATAISLIYHANIEVLKTLSDEEIIEYWEAVFGKGPHSLVI